MLSCPLPRISSGRCNNSSTDHKLIGVVEADGENDIELYGDVVSDSDLFQTNDSISLSWYGEESPSFTITFTSVSSEGATFTIDFND